MSQSKVHKIVVRPRIPMEGKVGVGANTEVLIDGIPLKGCSFFKFEAKAGKVNKVYMELFAEVEIETETELTQSEPKDTKYFKDGKHVSLYTLSSYSPTISAYFNKKS